MNKNSQMPVQNVDDPKIFHWNLSNFINGGCLSRADILLSAIPVVTPFKKNSVRMCQGYQNRSVPFLERGSVSSIVGVDVYKGRNTYVLEMMTYLEKYLRNDLFGAYVHGSLGIYEEIPYSDFDALAILKDEVFESPKRLARVAKRLSDARSIMLDFDPLQHHGWFVLTEADLKYYPEDYFPLELFRHAKSLFRDKGLELTVNIRNLSGENRPPFDELSNAIFTRITGRNYPKNMYELKGLMSEFMLLPSLYLQARDNKGVYKKLSFDAARADFSNGDWSAMDEVSALRKSWVYNMSALRRWVMTRPEPITRFLAKKCAPGIPDSLKGLLTDNFYAKMTHFVTLMREKLH
jgi:hypothetical protein